jgi:hypothetical protein
MVLGDDAGQGDGMLGVVGNESSMMSEQGNTDQEQTAG